MKQRLSLMGIILMMTCFAFGQTPVVIEYNPYTKMGAMPPEWLKNKVTDAQYDSLAKMSKYYSVDYDHFKQRNLTKEDICRYVKRTETMLSESMLNKSKLPNDAAARAKIKKMGIVPTDTIHYNVIPLPEGAKPFMHELNEFGDTVTKYILYSDIDGYDAHIMFEVQLSKDKDGNNQFTDGRLMPYSVSGLLVNGGFSLEERKGEWKRVIRNGTFGNNGRTPVYTLTGKFCFKDAKGYVHSRWLTQQVYLMLK